MKIMIIVGARPNFMKVEPIMESSRLAIRRRHKAPGAPCRPLLLHTGQYYDAMMSDVFFTDLDMPLRHGNASAVESLAATIKRN